ncbi:aminoglycoside phosphotransferase [Paucilactobacillus hokkaidonensis JCM 18461]|uniref:Aminoglycoside phosphotransferase n=2 Tax=Paucilactobacillus hokkaidonensis TaxID=1193095 RepID=A0A0A1GZ20_9LACO|nr:fructosamine kinase family protein [Paucilactobacillus hokkaidonensis]BAP85716.1 aminoglycoside phosphotransferase [Paucilactobacillus hokkaidonensis JCM 18461]
MTELNENWLNQLPVNNIKQSRPVSGGDINDAYQIITEDQTKYFLKVQPQHSKSYFDHEAAGLKLIGQVIMTPKPIAQGEINGDAYLLLNWIDDGSGSQHDLGVAVATMHQQHQTKFGFDHNHQSGNILKNNHWQSSWSTFYTEQRLDVLVEAANQNHVWNTWRQTHFDQMRLTFVNYYRNHEVIPSLLHGDLWSGNYMFSTDGTPILIDPDVFYGDRELDLAMTTIFGGFNDQFYQAYQDIYPLASGFEERLPWYQFYYLCMHLNLFGETYGGSVDRILGNY